MKIPPALKPGSKLSMSSIESRVEDLKKSDAALSLTSSFSSFRLQTETSRAAAQAAAPVAGGGAIAVAGSTAAASLLLLLMAMVVINHR